MRRPRIRMLLAGLAVSAAILWLIPLEQRHAPPSEKTRLWAAVVDVLDEGASSVHEGDVAGAAFLFTMCGLVFVAALLPPLLAVVRARGWLIAFGLAGLAGAAATLLLFLVRGASFGFGGGSVADLLPGFWALLLAEVACAGFALSAGCER